MDNYNLQLNHNQLDNEQQQQFSGIPQKMLDQTLVNIIGADNHGAVLVVLQLLLNYGASVTDETMPDSISRQPGMRRFRINGTALNPGLILLLHLKNGGKHNLTEGKLNSLLQEAILKNNLEVHILLDLGATFDTETVCRIVQAGSFNQFLFLFSQRRFARVNASTVDSNRVSVLERASDPNSWVGNRLKKIRVLINYGVNNVIISVYY